MTSRERVRRALNHQVTDRVPIDLGSMAVTTIHVQALKELRKKLGLEDRILKLQDPLLQCAEVEEDVREALQIDCIGLWEVRNNLGLHNTNWKKWTMPNGLDVLVDGRFACKVGDDGSVYAYAEGDTSYPPSARMPKGAFYFDPIVRNEDDMDEKDDWDAREDYKGLYTLYTDEEMRKLEADSIDLYNNTQCSVIGQYGWGGLADAFHVPGPWEREPKGGIRDLPNFMMALYEEPDYIKELFDMQSDIAIENLKMYKEAVQDRIDVLELSAADFGIQTGLMIPADLFREIYKPYYKKMTDWLRANVDWKLLIHSCGAVIDLIPDFIELGFDALNPVQVSAKGMDAEILKSRFGKDIVFWGGGCNPQQVMPYATPEEVYAETKRTAEILSRGGGFVGGNIHNVQPDVPAENLLAELQALKDTVPQPE